MVCNSRCNHAVLTRSAYASFKIIQRFKTEAMRKQTTRLHFSAEHEIETLFLSRKLTCNRPESSTHLLHGTGDSRTGHLSVALRSPGRLAAGTQEVFIAQQERPGQERSEHCGGAKLTGREQAPPSGASGKDPHTGGVAYRMKVVLPVLYCPTSSTMGLFSKSASSRAGEWKSWKRQCSSSGSSLRRQRSRSPPVTVCTTSAPPPRSRPPPCFPSQLNIPTASRRTADNQRSAPHHTADNRRQGGQARPTPGPARPREGRCQCQQHSRLSGGAGSVPRLGVRSGVCVCIGFCLLLSLWSETRLWRLIVPAAKVPAPGMKSGKNPSTAPI